MYVVKYFHEEPAALEVLAPDLDADARRRDAPAPSLADFLNAPRYYRGYLAGTDLGAGRTGLTAVPAAAFVPPLHDVFGAARWVRCDAAGHVASVGAGAVGAVLQAPADVRVLANADGDVAAEAVRAAAAGARRYALPALRTLLGAAHGVLFPEPAHDGFDWSFFAARPLRDAMTAALRRHRPAGVRCFALPFQKARSEEKFYFERYDLDRFAAYEVR